MIFRITQLEVDKYLEAIKNVDSVANTVQEAASHLQHRFEELIAEDKEMHDKACRGKFIINFIKTVVIIKIHNLFKSYIFYKKRNETNR